MSTKILGTASVLRHGATRYTQVFPDIVPEGLPLLRKSAHETVMQNDKSPLFVSSPAVRALGTTLEAMRAYGIMPQSEYVTTLRQLRPIDMYDFATVKTHVDRIAGGIEEIFEHHRIWDRYYLQAEEFEQGVICESRSSALRRFERFLHHPLATLSKWGRHVIVVTHVELIGQFVRKHIELNGNEFQPGEAAHFTFYEGNLAHMTFRGNGVLISSES